MGRLHRRLQLIVADRTHGAGAKEQRLGLLGQRRIP
jgi:hypothetical protein